MPSYLLKDLTNFNEIFTKDTALFFIYKCFRMLQFCHTKIYSEAYGDSLMPCATLLKEIFLD